MLSEEDVKTYISRKFPLGEKGYVKLWRKDNALGVMVFNCREEETGALNTPTDWWGTHRGIAIVSKSELDTVKQLIQFFVDGSVNFETPGVMTRGRFEKAFRDQMREHHNMLVENLRNRKNADRAVFGFARLGWGDLHSNPERTSKWVWENLQIFIDENPKLPIRVMKGEGRGQVLYGW